MSGIIVRLHGNGRRRKTSKRRGQLVDVARLFWRVALSGSHGLRNRQERSWVVVGGERDVIDPM